MENTGLINILYHHLGRFPEIKAFGGFLAVWLFVRWVRYYRSWVWI
jgi:hypothetical protein